jgi:hypothetical protein
MKLLRPYWLFIGILLGCIVLQHAHYVNSAEYDREAFEHWADPDGNGIDARNDALIKQNMKVYDTSFLVMDSTKKEVLQGFWVCPYTGVIFTDPTKMDVDHIVPLKWAWENGAEYWSPNLRMRFANDPQNLLVVAASANRSKGPRGPTTWLPPNLTYAEWYIMRFMEICDNYGLRYNKKDLLRVFNIARQHTKGLKLYKFDYRVK